MTPFAVGDVYGRWDLHLVLGKGNNQRRGDLVESKVCAGDDAVGAWSVGALVREPC